MLIIEKLFWQRGHRITGHKLKSSVNLGMRRFKAFFGVTPKVCGVIWNMLKNEKPDKAKPEHLLWALNFLRQYEGEHTRSALFKADEKTIRKWTWCFIELIAGMEIVIFFKNSTLLRF